VVLFNHSEKDFAIATGDRIAQLILERIERPAVIEVDDLVCWKVQARTIIVGLFD
jgi:dUTP pyrophosphatase